MRKKLLKIRSARCTIDQLILVLTYSCIMLQAPDQILDTRVLPGLNKIFESL